MVVDRALEAEGRGERRTVHKLNVPEEFRYVYIIGYGRTGCTFIQLHKLFLAVRLRIIGLVYGLGILNFSKQASI